MSQLKYFYLLAFTITLFTGLVGRCSLASEEVYISKEAGETSWWVLYPVEDVWRLQHYKAQTQGFQDFVEEQSFANKQAALALLETQTGLTPLSDPALPVQNLDLQNRTEEAGEVLWQTRATWSQDWEKRYAAWTEETLEPHFFERYQIATDCADAIFALRWIFARTFGLPAANHLAGSRMLFTNESFRTKWKGLKSHSLWHKDERFLAALNYLMANTYTHSLFRDSHPIAINQDSFLAGTYHLEIRKRSGHAKIVNLTHYDKPQENPFSFLFSDVPQVVRTLLKGDFWEVHAPSPSEGGFMQFRWPVRLGQRWELQDKALMPNFSQEQYSGTLAESPRYYEALTERLQPKMDPAKRIESGVEFISEQITNRIMAVEEGYAYCQRQSCVKGTNAYESWSTPTRDRRLRETILEVENYVLREASFDPRLRALWNQLTSDTRFTIEGHTLQLRELNRIFLYQLYASEPWLAPLRRWGLEQAFQQ